LMPMAIQITGDSFGVGFVHLAADGDDVVSHGFTNTLADLQRGLNADLKK
jgi:hypothetical protein